MKPISFSPELERTSEMNDRCANGAPVASLLAAGIGSVALGIFTVLTEASPSVIKPLMTISEAVGPLSGKTTYSIMIYLLSWIVLHRVLVRRELDEQRWLRISMFLVIMGIVMTFPPLFQLFTASH